jgi:hypothetical protein
MIKLPNTHTELDGYKEDMAYAARIDGNRDFYFVSRWFPVYLMDIKIRNLTVKDFLILQAENNDILKERFNFSDCVKLIYLLHYNPTNSIVIRSFREYFLGKKIIKYVQKKYPNKDVEEAVRDIVSEYFDNLLNDFPSRNVPIDGSDDKPKETRYYGYSWGAMICRLMETYHMSEKDIMDLPIQVFFEYYQCILCSKNYEYVRKGKVDYVETSYIIRFEKLKRLIK